MIYIPQAPSAFAGFNITTISGFKFALYDNLLLSMDSKYQVRERPWRRVPFAFGSIRVPTARRGRWWSASSRTCCT